jgi:hypothetical protein
LQENLMPSNHDDSGGDEVGNESMILKSDIDGNDVEDKASVLEKEATDGPMKILKPLRTDPVKALQSRQRRLDRFAAVAMPEVHYVGQILSGKGLVHDASEGACCR